MIETENAKTVSLEANQLSEIVEDLSETAKKLDSILSTLKYQVLSNADSVEESVRSMNGAAHLPSVEDLIKKPIRRQIGNLGPAVKMLENLVQRLGPKLENQNGDPDTYI